jgi:gas vesicle protein
MAYSDHKSSAEMEREIEAQRQQIERRIGEIQERLSPGQLLDEALSYTRDGGAKFASGLGREVAANPIPTALLGVSLAWLIAGSMSPSRPRVEESRFDSYGPYPEPKHPYATIRTGGLRRTSHSQTGPGEWVSEFADDTGRKFKAKANEMGHRAGHFVDDTGKTLSGFVDEAGQRVTDFRDEAGSRMDDAMGWASHTWRDASEMVGNMASDAANGLRKAGDAAYGMASDAADGASHLAHGVGHAASDAARGMRHAASSASHAAGDLQAQTDQLARSLMRALEDQPLVAGALAFAAGAALGAALPHTEQEDAAFGKVSDDVTSRAAKVAEEFYEEGKERVEALYEHGKEEVEKAYDKAAHQVEDAYQKVADTEPGNGKATGLH